MPSPTNREALGKYMSDKEARALGLFSGTNVSGYYMPPGEQVLMPYYTARVSMRRWFGRPADRDVIILNQGNQWFIGSRASGEDPAQMLQFLHKGISNGRREMHAVDGNDLKGLLGDPSRLPEIKLPVAERVSRAMSAMRTFVRAAVF